MASRLNMAAVFGVADLERVQALAKRYPVFPCGADKRPRVERGFHAATQDPKQIREWWTRWPDALVGVPTGQGTGLVVIDYDPDKATQATHAWIAQHTDLLCSTRAHKTGRGGLHYLFRSKDRYQTGTDLVLGGSPRKGIDLRANGGYVIWWPLHVGQDTETPIAPLPADLIDERRFDRARDMAPLPTATPASWRAERNKVADALGFLGPDGYEHWIRIGMAIHSASGGSDDGFALWHDWSARGDSYDGVEDCRYHWQSFGTYAGRGIGLGSLFSAAKAAGYSTTPAMPEYPPIEAYTDEPELAEPRAAAPEPDAPAIEAGLWVPVDEASIPPRPWLYGWHYQRGMIGLTAGAGGAGKSTIVLVEAISMALGRDLFRGGELLKVGPVHVWYHNGEDPKDELDRRIVAICKHYRLDPREVAQRLHVTSGRTTRLIVAIESQNAVIYVPETVAGIVHEIERHAIAAFITDPFISTHQVPENSNPLMEQVMWQYRAIAERTQAAIETVHHFRKGNGQEVGSDDIRGATAIIGACRSVRVVAPMEKAEAETLGVPDKERRRFVWMQNPKANMRPASDERTWRELQPVSLDNAAGPYEADSVGVAVPWAPISPNQLVRYETRCAIVRDMRELQSRDPLALRADPRSKRWAGNLVADRLGIDVADKLGRSEVARVLDGWVKDGLLEKVVVADPAEGRKVPVLRVAERED